MLGSIMLCLTAQGPRSAMNTTCTVSWRSYAVWVSFSGRRLWNFVVSWWWSLCGVFWMCGFGLRAPGVAAAGWRGGRGAAQLAARLGAAFLALW